MEIKEQKEQLKRIQENLNSVEDVRQEKQIREHLEELMHREQILWAQKAKINWDLNGDHNTKYFQTVVKNKRRYNCIIQIRTKEETWTSDSTEIQQVFLSYYQKLFSQDQHEPQEDDLRNQLSSIPIPTLTEQQASKLDL